MVKTLKTKPTEPIKNISVKKATPKKETPKKPYGTYMDENGTIDWDKLKALLK